MKTITTAILLIARQKRVLFEHICHLMMAFVLPNYDEISINLAALLNYICQFDYVPEICTCPLQSF